MSGKFRIFLPANVAVAMTSISFKGKGGLDVDKTSTYHLSFSRTAFWRVGVWEISTKTSSRNELGNQNGGALLKSTISAQERKLASFPPVAQLRV